MANNNVIKTCLDFTVDFKNLCDKYDVHGYFNIFPGSKGNGFSRAFVKENDEITTADIEERTFRSLVTSTLGRYDCIYAAKHDMFAWMMDEMKKHIEFLEESEAYFKEHPEKVINAEELTDLFEETGESK